MGTFFESEKDKVAKGERWDLPFICCAQDNPNVPTAIRLWETFIFTYYAENKNSKAINWKTLFDVLNT